MADIGKLIEKSVRKILELFYSKDKLYERYVLLLMVIGIILRIPSALNSDFLADDSIYASQSANIWNAHLISTHSHPALFFYLTDLAYKIFGYTTFAARLFPLLSGTFLIPLVYLITRKLFDKKTALLAAIFTTFSNFIIRMTFTEHSLVTFFLVFLGIYLGLIYLDNKNIKILGVSAIFFGLGCLTKYNSVFFVIAFVFLAMIRIKNKHEKIFSKNNLKHLLLFVFVIFIFCIPFLAFNYFLYQDKGIVDFQFQRIIKTEKAQQLFSGLGGQDSSFIKDIFNINKYDNYKLIFKTDLLIFIFSIIGLGYWIYKKEKVASAFFWILLIIPFLLQSPANALTKHFVFMSILFCIPAGYGLNEVLKRINKKYIKYLLMLLIISLMIFNLGTVYGVPHGYISPSATDSLKSYINQNVQPKDLIIFDSRDYTAKSFWLATPHNFLLLNQFSEFYKFNQEKSKNLVPTSVYVVECAIDDCGWGWVKDNQELNQTAENLLSALKNYSNSETSITEYEYSSNEFMKNKKEITRYRVYKIQIYLDPSIVLQTKQIESFYFAPYMYLNMNDYIFDYQTSGFGSLVNNLALWIIYSSVVIVLFSFILVIILL
jgi:4-amino-4-deoxy-L-arabinose transferase-like glycosyltransferase